MHAVWGYFRFSCRSGICNRRIYESHDGKRRYGKSFSAAVNITSATTGLIIPPSNILIIYSLASGGISIAALFLAGYVPGILIGLALMIVAAIYSILRKYPTEKSVGLRVFFKRFLDALPSLLLLIVVIGGIVAGIFTATEASAVAVIYTFVLAFAYKEITVKDVSGILLETTKTTSIVMLLIATSVAMSWMMSYESIPQEISAGLLGISNNPIVILIIINFILLFCRDFYGYDTRCTHFYAHNFACGYRHGRRSYPFWHYHDFESLYRALYPSSRVAIVRWL